MERVFKHILITVCISILLLSCSSDNNPNVENQPEFGNLSLNFTNNVGNDPLEMDNSFYQKNGNETFNVSELKYIISNIVLIDEDANEFVYPQEDSYFLINEEVQITKSVVLENIDANQYTSIRFGIGVDQTNYPLNGVNNFVPTAEDQDMTWSWSAGYIFFKIEGKYTSPTNTEKDFKFHMGSHGTSQDNYREVSLNFLQPLAVREVAQPEINIELDILKVFDSEFSLELKDKDDIQIDPVNAPKIAENISKSFEIILN
jgi:hypothetical protein